MLDDKTEGTIPATKIRPRLLPWAEYQKLPRPKLTPQEVYAFYKKQRFQWTEKEIYKYVYRKKRDPFPTPKKLSKEDYDVLLKIQHGVCFICHRPPKKRRLAHDHCHRTGITRGLLCYTCNYTLGVWGDDADRFERAAFYLRRSQQ